MTAGPSPSGSVPAVVIAAPASGSGKTTIATGLMGALRATGVVVAPFKVGPDYIDPGYHTLAAGRPGRNLDPVMVGPERIGPLFRHGASGSDLAVVEGVMGLFDGRIDAEATAPVAHGSTAHVATLLGAPVVLVVDARGHSQSLAALLHGFATFDASVRLAGVVLNRVGSARHEQVLRQACERVGLPVLGVVPRLAELEVPSRHLGLIPAAEHGLSATRAVAAMTDLATRTLDIPAIRAIASAGPDGPVWDPAVEVAAHPARAATGGHTTRPVVAVAGGRAFTFGYVEHRELLEAAGAEVVVFDPVHDRLPPGTSGVVLPGGFPEEHAADLAANDTLRGQLRAHAAAGGPIHAECAGLLYLTAMLDGHAMSGVIDVAARFASPLTLGYRDAVAVADSSVFPAGTRVVGHEFHRTALDSPSAVGFDAAWGWRGVDGAPVLEGFVGGSGHAGVHASYLHTHPAGHPEGIRRFVDAARAWAAGSDRE
ncbi:cobyrinate a,c-diamide synthase [Rhodococcus triatomae]|nr:cobyrinate a,c-diamide synthase [Rhodococcus triatomae]QNG21375.1 cobyrinate a,c-diamide synthase [Rhodococcus triatomae]QNG25885.1 cobyrinate a,c-diamide synthase [Rhodococcus triatomae]